MTFEFTEQQVAQIMQTLAQRPYGEVFDLIATIQRQAQQQAQQGGQAPRLQPVPAGS
jgi:hypothetical protein